MPDRTANVSEDGTPQFAAWPKIHRLYRPVLITEKIDGTNAAIGILEDGTVYAQSRKRIITLEQDNHGFATWVRENQYDLRETLGAGLHFGEWYGPGIGKRYAHKGRPQDAPPKQFALFNVKRWQEVALPDRVCTVPLLFEGTFSDDAVRNQLELLRMLGSPSGAQPPEGLVVYHVAANTSFKVTLEHDEISKGELAAQHYADLELAEFQVGDVEPVGVG